MFSVVPLIEIFVAEEVDGVENVPPIILKGCELSILRSENNSAGLVFLDIGHHVLLSDVDKVIFAYIESSQAQVHLLFIGVTTGELDEALK